MLAWLAWTSLVLAVSSVRSQSVKPVAPLSAAVINRIEANLAASATLSWEIGTRLEAIAELRYPSYSAFDASPFTASNSRPTVILNTVETLLARRNGSNVPLIDGDGSAGDPASLGASFLLADRLAPSPGSDAFPRSAYGQAALEQLQILLERTPRTAEGAISHREAEVQLWADEVYMVPPFIAYFGTQTANITLLQFAYDQIRLYRAALADADGLWRHIAFGATNWDNKRWATGQAWVAAGMVRTLAILEKSSFKGEMTSQRADLAAWTAEALKAAWATQRQGLVLNYPDRPNTFGDTAATALLSATAYRLAQLGYDASTIGQAEKGRAAVHAAIDKAGWLAGCVHPLYWHRALRKGEHSAEGQAFVLMMQAAYLDYAASIKPAPALPVTKTPARPPVKAPARPPVKVPARRPAQSPVRAPVKAPAKSTTRKAAVKRPRLRVRHLSRSHVESLPVVYL